MPTSPDEISEEDRLRIQRSTLLLSGYVNFMRWAGNFRRDEIQKHPRHAGVMMLSPLQSGRFAFATEGNALLLGAQPFEMAWLGVLPFEAAYVSDRLYLTVSGAQCMDVNLPPLTVGIFVNSKRKLATMAECGHVAPVRIAVQDGAVVEVANPEGMGFPIRSGDVVKALNTEVAERRNKRDLARYF